jgi:hypothetical protein
LREDGEIEDLERIKGSCYGYSLHKVSLCTFE